MIKPIKELQFNSRFPIESFDPRYKKIWMKAILEEIAINFNTEKEAMAFQARIHMYRSRLRKSNDASAAMLYRAKTSRKGSVLFIRPADKPFESTLAQFGEEDEAKYTQPSSEAPIFSEPITVKSISIDELFSEFNVPTEENFNA